jgi:transcriptional regulator with XRE-family HTH domain
LALSCDLDRTFIGKLERGKRQLSITTIFRIAEALEMEPKDFVKEIQENLEYIRVDPATSQ